MFSTDTEKIYSAARTWQRASYAERQMMMLEAGHAETRLHTYKHWEQLPMELRLDLNAKHTKKLHPGTGGKRRVIDVLRNAQALGCRLTVNSTV